MTHPGQTSSEQHGPAIAGLDVLQSTGRKRPPVEQWNPAQARDIDMRIATDGTWHYLGSPIARPAMVRLFASILRLEPDARHALVTPVEKCFITVEDAPFLAVSLDTSGTGQDQRLTFTTNLGDTVTAGPGHPITFRQDGNALVPYVEVRNGLNARINRATYYELMDLAESVTEGGNETIGIWSGGTFWPVSETGNAGPAGAEQ